jgi:uroporphyrinogen decarboxylase
LFLSFAVPYLRRIATEVRKRTPPVSAGGPPLIVFPRAAHARSALEALCDSEYDVIGLDWGMDAKEATSVIESECKRLGKPVKGVQGNLDPTALHAPRRVLVREVARMLQDLHDFPGGHVGNLGHGMAPSHKPEQLALFFDAMQEISKKMRNSTAAAGGGSGGGKEAVTEADLDAMAKPLEEGGLGRINKG